ncbi:NAD+ synthase [Candidatus Gottesmanbacteria bacterium]|nr:NAD+ synthase [Candidatus Gottesmanbacteria bacterium]
MMSIDSKKVSQKLIEFIKAACKKAGFSRAVIALSGGVDSSTSLALSVQALGKDNVFPLLLPYGDLNPQGVVDANLLIDKYDLAKSHVFSINIKSFVDPMLALDAPMDNVRQGNIMARTRMILLFDEAKKQNALVIGTENKTEHLLGYFTRFGDSASDIEPLRNLYKTQVYELAKHLGIPEQILNKKPTAGLWEGQTDEGEFGFTYKDADEILLQLFDEKKIVEDIVASGFDRSLVEKVQSWVSKNSFKHNLPILP